MKRRYWILVLGAALGVALLLQPASIAGILQTAAPAQQYLTAPIERGDIRTTLSATGTLNAVGTVKVSSQLSGQIAEVLVSYNDRVAKGQPLAKLDPTAFEARVRQAEAALESANARIAMARAGLERAAASMLYARSTQAMAEAQTQSARAKADNAKRDFERKRALVERAILAQAMGENALAANESASAMLQAAEAEQAGMESTVATAAADHKMATFQLLNAQAVLKQQTAILDQARADLANTVIRAPVDGEVIGRDVDRGQIVAASLSAPTLFVIAQDLREMEVHARVDEADIGRVRLGQTAGFSVDASPGRIFSGRVVQIRKAPTLVQNVVTYTVVLAAPNSDLTLLPGMTALAQIIVDQAKDVLRIPNAALRFRPAETAGPAGSAQAAEGRGSGTGTVWVLAESGPTKVHVRLGRSNASATELVDGPIGTEQKVIVGVAPQPASSWLFPILEAMPWRPH
jgi:HlyD family secretion protein